MMNTMNTMSKLFIFDPPRPLRMRHPVKVLIVE